MAVPVDTTTGIRHPDALTASLDPGLSRWKWLVKWVLAIPHLVVLAFLWPAFVVVTVIAGSCILITGRYPRSLFDFTSDVLRWTWRVSYYATTGGLGTDRYPPLRLSDAPGYPARLDVAYPSKLSRGLVLVKWALALPHVLIIGLLVTNWWGWTSTAGERFAVGPVGSGGLLGLLVVIAVVVLLFTARYPQRLFAVIVGVDRGIYRVVAYLALMTDSYPPFRLDQGSHEPAPMTTPPSGTTVAPRHEPATVGAA